MTPDQISILDTVAFILKTVKSWPIGSIFLVAIVGPWIMMFLISRGQEKRFEAVTKMYEKNVDLVKAYETIAKSQQSVILLNTEKMTEVDLKIDNNLYCPLVRKTVKQREAELL